MSFFIGLAVVAVVLFSFLAWKDRAETAIYETDVQPYRTKISPPIAWTILIASVIGIVWALWTGLYWWAAGIAVVFGLAVKFMWWEDDREQERSSEIQLRRDRAESLMKKSLTPLVMEGRQLDFYWQEVSVGHWPNGTIIVHKEADLIALEELLRQNPSWYTAAGHKHVLDSYRSDFVEKRECQGFCIRPWGDNQRWLIVVSRATSSNVLGTMAHEIVHAVDGIFRHKGLPLTPDNEEERAHLAGKIMGAFIEEWNRAKLSPEPL